MSHYMLDNTAWERKIKLCYNQSWRGHVALLPDSSLWFLLVKAWADAFRSSPDLTGVVSVYEDLRRKGVEFPMTELDGYSPVQAPKKVQQAWLVHSLLTYHLWSFLFGVISVHLLTRLCLGTGLLSPLCLLCSSLPNLRSSHLRLLS